jgi:hypothetical protein
MREPSSKERELLDLILNHEFPGQAELVSQIPGLHVTEVNVNGWLALYPICGLPAPVRYLVPIEASYQDADGTVVHISLHVVDGYMRDFEVFKEDGSLVIDHAHDHDLTFFCPTWPGTGTKTCGKISSA